MSEPPAAPPAQRPGSAGPDATPGRPTGRTPISTDRTGQSRSTPPRAPAASRRRRDLLLVAVVAVVGVAAGTFAGMQLSDRPHTPEPTTTTPAAPVDIEASVTSVDPSGGSGFERRGGEWRTQTYRSARFGGLKPGVGLVLDLGRARRVTTITFEAGTPGSTVSLRASDTRPTTGEGLTAVGESVTAAGKTTLPAGSGGAHRYWVVWVTELGSRSGGYGTTFSTPVVSGPPA